MNYEALPPADGQEGMIERYLERGVPYVLDDGGAKAECVVVRQRLKSGRRFGLSGSRLRQDADAFFRKRYAGRCDILQVGIGESLPTAPFNNTGLLLCIA